MYILHFPFDQETTIWSSSGYLKNTWAVRCSEVAICPREEFIGQRSYKVLNQNCQFTQMIGEMMIIMIFE